MQRFRPLSLNPRGLHIPTPTAGVRHTHHKVLVVGTQGVGTQALLLVGTLVVVGTRGTRGALPMVVLALPMGQGQGQGPRGMAVAVVVVVVGRGMAVVADQGMVEEGTRVDQGMAVVGGQDMVVVVGLGMVAVVVVGQGMVAVVVVGQGMVAVVVVGLGMVAVGLGMVVVAVVEVEEGTRVGKGTQVVGTRVVQRMGQALGTATVHHLHRAVAEHVSLCVCVFVCVSVQCIVFRVT